MFNSLLMYAKMGFNEHPHTNVEEEEYKDEIERLEWMVKDINNFNIVKLNHAIDNIAMHFDCDLKERMDFLYEQDIDYIREVIKKIEDLQDD